MKYKVMVIDDRPSRQSRYDSVLSCEEFEPIYIFNRSQLHELAETPVDAYLIDVFLDTGDWKEENETAATLLEKHIQKSPRSAPVFLVSEQWSRDKALEVIKQCGQSSAAVVDYLAWSDFEPGIQNEISNTERTASRLRTRLLTELDRWHGRSSFRPRPDDSIRILLLSDMQYEDPETDNNATYAESWIVDRLQNDNLNKGIPLPDLIVLAGDITYSGSPHEFAIAEDRLMKDLILKLWPASRGGGRDRLIVIPGNHDVNLRFAAVEKRIYSPKSKEFKDDSRQVPSYEPPDVPYSTHHAYALEPFRRFAYRLTMQREWLDEPIRSWVDRRFLHCGISFYLLNSVAKIDAQNPDRACFEEKELLAIDRSIKGSIPSDTFNIAISHHGRYVLDRKESNLQDVNNEKIIENIGKHYSFFPLQKIRLWLFGHYHKFGKDHEYQGTFEDVPLWLVSLPTTRIKSKKLGFCVLELERKNGVVCDAKIQEYAIDGGGGKPVGTPIRVFGK
jgi:hypothetical protein